MFMFYYLYEKYIFNYNENTTLMYYINYYNLHYKVMKLQLFKVNYNVQ